MIDKRTAVVIAMLGIGLLFAATAAGAASLDAGEYTLSLPGVGVFEFEVSDGEPEAIRALMAPQDYQVDGEADVVAWRQEFAAAESEVEIKPDRVEADVAWRHGAVVLRLPGDGLIVIAPPNGKGAFIVTAKGDWWAFGDGEDWYVADNPNITLARSFFKVEAHADGVEIVAVDSVDEGFLSDLREDEAEAGVSGETKGEGNGRGKGQGKARGQGKGNG